MGTVSRERAAKGCSDSIAVITIGVVTCRSTRGGGYDASFFCKHSARLRNPTFGSWHLRFGAVIPTSSNPALNEDPSARDLSDAPEVGGGTVRARVKVRVEERSMSNASQRPM